MLSIITCRETVLGPRNTLTEKINLLLFRARDILRKRPKLAKRSKSKNVFLKHLTLVLSLISQIRTKFQSSLVYIKNNQIDVRSENESYEFKEDNVLPVGGAYLLSSFENALVYSENKKTTVQPHSKRNYRKFQMAIVPALETLFTHFSDLIRLVVRGDQLMCVNINEELQKRDVIIQIPDLINSLKNETDNKYGMQKVPMKPVSIDYETLFYTDDEEYTTDDDDDDDDNESLYFFSTHLQTFLAAGNARDFSLSSSSSAAAAAAAAASSYTLFRFSGGQRTGCCCCSCIKYSSNHSWLGTQHWTAVMHPELINRLSGVFSPTVTAMSGFITLIL